jgi:tRNA threonylcarbamoyladenosine modification (KEOPS) complex  Pcc1 subunit
MSAGVYKLTIEQGETFNPILTWKDETEALVNLTGYTARMQIRKSVDASAFLLECTTENGRITLGGALGTIALSVSAADTAALPAGIFRYDLELISGGGIVTKLMKGDARVIQEVTR